MRGRGARDRNVHGSSTRKLEGDGRFRSDGGGELQPKARSPQPDEQPGVDDNAQPAHGVVADEVTERRRRMPAILAGDSSWSCRAGFEVPCALAEDHGNLNWPGAVGPQLAGQGRLERVAAGRQGGEVAGPQQLGPGAAVPRSAVVEARQPGEKSECSHRPSTGGAASRIERRCWKVVAPTAQVLNRNIIHHDHLGQVDASRTRNRHIRASSQTSAKGNLHAAPAVFADLRANLAGGAGIRRLLRCRPSFARSDSRCSGSISTQAIPRLSRPANR
jgi:hypothetical protein